MPVTGKLVEDNALKPYWTSEKFYLLNGETGLIQCCLEALLLLWSLFKIRDFIEVGKEKENKSVSKKVVRGGPEKTQIGQKILT